MRGLAHEQGVAVLLATHLAEEEVKVADRMMLLAIWARCVLAAPPKTLWRRRTETICMLCEEVFKHLCRPALKINTSDAGVCMTVLQRDENSCCAVVRNLGIFNNATSPNCILDNQMPYLLLHACAHSGWPRLP